MSYVIRIKPYFCNLEMYWSNEFGWTDLCDADVFSHEETLRFRLPMNAEWQELAA